MKFPSDFRVFVPFHIANRHVCAISPPVLGTVNTFKILAILMGVHDFSLWSVPHPFEVLCFYICPYPCIFSMSLEISSLTYDYLHVYCLIFMYRDFPVVSPVMVFGLILIWSVRTFCITSFGFNSFLNMLRFTLQSRIWLILVNAL